MFTPTSSKTLSCHASPTHYRAMSTPSRAEPDEGFDTPPMILTPPSFDGTPEEYAAVCAADEQRYAWINKHWKVVPTLDHLIGKGVPPVNVDPEPARGRTASSPEPTRPSRARTGLAHGSMTSQRANVNVSQALSAKTAPSVVPLPPDLPYLSAKVEGMQMVEPLMAQRPTSYLRPGIRRQDIPGIQAGSVEIEDRQSLMPIAPTFAQKLYCMELTLDPIHHFRHVTRTYTLPIDTASKLTWFFFKNFLQIPPKDPNVPDPDPSSFPTIEWVVTPKSKSPFIRTVIPIHSRTQAEQPFALHSTPGSDEWKVEYADGSVAYLRHVPDSDIRLKIPVWHWKDGKQDASPFELPCILAFAANSEMICHGYDGLIGLSVPSKPKLHKPYVGSMADRHTFCDALEYPNVQVDQPRQFLIKLNHPDKIAACNKSLAKDFLSFGKFFPCPLKPRFTPEIPIHHVARQGIQDFFYWLISMKSMSLIVPEANGQFSELKINMIDPEASLNQSLDGAPPRETIYVMLDSGSSGTRLPSFVANQIRDEWLKNSADILNLRVNTRVHSYCGPERNLDECDIVFTFVGYGNSLVDFRCPAKPFLKSWTRLPSEDGPAQPPSHYCTNLRASTGGPDDMFVLGINFYWSAFVEHCAPDTDSLWPHVRLAPQRAAISDEVMGSAEHFYFFPDIPPRYFQPAPET